MPFLAHATMETPGALIDLKQDSALLIASLQSPGGASEMISALTGIPRQRDRYPHDALRRRLRPAPRERFRRRSRADREGGRQARQADLDARGRSAARFLPAVRRARARARRSIARRRSRAGRTGAPRRRDRIARTTASGTSSTAASSPTIFRPASSPISTRRSSACRPACRAAGGARRYTISMRSPCRASSTRSRSRPSRTRSQLRLAMLGEPRQIPYSGHGGPTFDTGRLANVLQLLREKDRLGRQARRRPRHRHRLPLHVRRLCRARVRGVGRRHRAQDPSRGRASPMSAASSIRSASKRR